MASSKADSPNAGLEEMGEAWGALNDANEAVAATGAVQSRTLTLEALRVLKKRAKAFERAVSATLDKIDE